jgi:hypothetical protein
VSNFCSNQYFIKKKKKKKDKKKLLHKKFFYDAFLVVFITGKTFTEKETLLQTTEYNSLKILRKKEHNSLK